MRSRSFRGTGWSVARYGVAVLALSLGMATAEARAGQQGKAPQTSDQANSDSLGSAMVSPLRDINVVRAQIPDLLKKAAADPYAPPSPGCEPLQAEIDQLDAVLGDDYDEPKDKKSDEGGLSKPVLGAVASVVSDVIPMRGWVRRLTGAEAHDEQIRQAIKAGMVRRGYLKGLYNAGTCKGNRLIYVAAKPAPAPIQVAAEPAPVHVAAAKSEVAPAVVAAPLTAPTGSPFTMTIRVATTAGVP
jgi:hypothetical protein